MIASLLQRIKENLVSNILLGVGIILSLAAGILYALTGVTIYTAQSLDGMALAMPFVCVGLGLLSIPFGFKMVKYIDYLAALLAFLAFLRFEVSYIVNVFVGIDRTSFSAPFILNFAFLILAVVCFLVSAILQKEVSLGKANALKEEKQ